MDFFYNYNPCAIAFYFWVSLSPFGGHNMDLKRFYTFVNTVHHYAKEGKVWRDFDYFLNKVREYGYKHKEEIVRRKFDQMIEILQYLDIQEGFLPKKEKFKNRNQCDEWKYQARIVYKNNLIVEDISKEEFENNKVSKKSFGL